MGHTRIKFIFIVLLFAMAVSCSIKINEKPVINNSYRVERIDSLNNYYIIYISNENKKYKIVSKKFHSDCIPIKANYTYPSFIFNRLIKEEDYIPKDRPANYLDFVPNEIKLNDTTIIKRDRGMDNIYSTPNLNGLCYRP